jgi:superfamily I DNA/RNA helicase
MESHLASLRPQVILSRSDVVVIGNLIRYLSKGMRCHVLGGTKGLQLLLTDVKRVKQGAGAQSLELLGFSTWKDVMSFSGRTEGEYLRGLVNLVQEYGEDVILRTLARCEAAEGSANIVLTTTHKAKGREWGYVAVDSDFESALSRSSSTNSDRNASFEAELRLLYVAVTRAMTAVQLPQAILERSACT